MPYNQREEVIWPRLVANKLFKKPVSNNSFVADFPSCDKVISALSSICDDHQILKRPQESQRDPLTYKLFTSTWNVGGVIPPDDLNLEGWLDTRNNSHDIYVLGFQEVVPLNAKNILGPEKSKITMKWNSLIRETLNKSISDSRKEHETMEGEIRKSYPVKEASSSSVQDFQCIVSKQMVGILVSVWVRCDLQRYINSTSVSCVGCGFMGCLGNKVGEKGMKYTGIQMPLKFSPGQPSHEATFSSCHRRSLTMNIHLYQCIWKFYASNFEDPCVSRVVFLGDLNYRISLPESRTRSQVEQKKWKTLLQNDQLRGEVTSGGAFEGWQEGAITFSPTYKYFPNSDTYYDCIQGKKGKKKRAPAWCDRILWTGRGFKQIYYDRCELMMSDHRPVRALFSVNVDALRNLNSVRNFFLSDSGTYKGCSEKKCDIWRKHLNNSPNRIASLLKLMFWASISVIGW